MNIVKQIEFPDSVEINKNWFYSLRIKNLTKENLEQKHCNNKHGKWNTNNRKDKKPIDVMPSKEYTDALKINAKDIEIKPIEFSCTWQTDRLGTITLNSIVRKKGNKKHNKIDYEINHSESLKCEYDNLHFSDNGVFHDIIIHDN